MSLLRIIPIIGLSQAFFVFVDLGTVLFPPEQFS